MRGADFNFQPLEVWVEAGTEAFCNDELYPLTFFDFQKSDRRLDGCRGIGCAEFPEEFSR